MEGLICLARGGLHDAGGPNRESIRFVEVPGASLGKYGMLAKMVWEGAVATRSPCWTQGGVQEIEAG